MSALNFEALLTTRNFEAGMQRIRNDIRGTSNLAVQEAARMDSAFKNLSIGMASYFSAQSLKGFVMELINIRGEFQKTEIAFSTMLGNGGQAKQLMGQMVNLAAKTPFSLQDVSNGAKQLLAFQVPANEVVDTLTRMGNIAAGLSVPIQRINLVYGQVKAKGKLMGDDLRQFTEAGIPMIHELAKAMGKADSEIAKMVSDGKIGFEDVKKVLFNLTNEGGMFFNLMEEQSATLSGKISNLGDAWDQMLNKIGQSQEGALGQGIDALAYLVDHYKEVLNIIEALVVVYGAYRAALITISAVEAFRSRTITRDIAAMSFSEKMALGRALVIERQAQANLMEAQTELAAANAKLANAQADKTAMGAIMASNAAKEVKIATTRVETAQEALSIATKNASTLSEVRLTAAQQLREASLRALAAAEAFLNATMLSNPYVLVTVAVVGLIYAYFKLRDTTTALEKAEKSLAENRQKNTKILDELTSKTQEYLNVLRSDYATALQKRLNYEKLLALYPDLLKSISMETLATMDLVEANKLLAKEKDKKDKDLLIGDIEKTKEQIKNLKTILSTNGITGPSAESLGLESHNWSGMTGYRKDLEAAEIALKKQQFLLDRRNESEKIANMTVEQRKTYYENELKSLESQLFQHKQKNKHLKDADILTIKLGNSLSNLSVSSLILEIKKAQAELSSLQSAAKPVDKNKAFWEAQRKEASDANDNMSGKQIGGAEWNNNIKKIREADLQLKKYDYSLKKTKKEGRQIAEILPVGSIAELQRRAKLIEDAGKVAVNGMVKLRTVDKYGSERDKKGKPYYTGEVISVEEAKKRVEDINRKVRQLQAESQAKTFSEEMDETKRQIGVRDKLLQQGYSKDSVDKMFPKIKDKSFLQYLEETDIAVKKLISSGKGDKETAENLALISKTISEYKGLETYIEGVSYQIDVLKTKFSGNELISQLDRLKILDPGDSTEEERAAKERAIVKAQEDERMRIEANYNQLLNDHKTFEEKKAKITRDLNDALGLAKNDSEKEKIRKAYNEQFSAITVEAFRNSKDWETAFGEMEFASKSTLERILQQLINFRQANKENLSVQDYKIVSDKITEIQNRLNISNPLASLIQGYRDYRKASEDLKKKQEELNQANLDLAESYQLLNKAQSGEEFNVADQKRVDALKRRKKATEEVQQAEIILSEKQIKLLDSLNYVSKYFNDVRSVISSVKGIFDDLGISMDNAFGDILANLEQTMQGFEQFQQGLTNAFKGFASGNIIQGIAGSIQAIGGLIKSISGWFNNDKKKERQIKSWANEVENLKNMYKELEYAVKKALGDDIYKGQLDQVKNLQQQQQLLIQMRNKEADKKKSDQGKINDYNSQIEDINRAIQDIRDNIIKTVLQTDAKDLAAQLGDAFIEAFSKGEDAAKALDKVAGDVFRNMVKNALKMRMEKALQPVLDQILKASGFDEKGNGSFKGFTPEQIEQYKKQIAQIGASQEEFLKAYQQLFQDANTNVSGMEGSIKSITSEEAGALIAQINAMRINQGKTINIHQENLELMRGVLMQLMKIEDNTRNLHQMRKDLSELNSKVSKDNGLRPAGL
ncbi:tape measure protein [Elizabethkingia miricola]|uniref:tape measure protein n=1 Tax=Elizabethkingia miricola TaxID=172045 RepID=UPI000B35CBAC|nr:tape measure protein [Elizabethkingia miricola]NHQ67195.1 tape measure protein [Elizabethkingia miricola]NHQ70544.1 tape measure protein [Elizabethkingia miricola]NHQ76525.1 tape measure protein [Elizabethkingia miricola]UIO96342.1 tape measure protein [Elizabethkingia miricola]WER13128.1 tape measure protein [Elizabethkingia miricola]